MAVLPQVPVTDFEKAGFTPTMTGFFIRLANVFSLLAQGTGFVLTANRAVISDGSGGLAASDVTSTEVGFLDGATSNIQTQINTVVSRVDDMYSFFGYLIRDIDASAPAYYGYENDAGEWMIVEETISGVDTAFRRAEGTSGYSTAWTNRATQTYV